MILEMIPFEYRLNICLIDVFWAVSYLVISKRAYYYRVHISTSSNTRHTSIPGTRLHGTRSSGSVIVNIKRQNVKKMFSSLYSSSRHVDS